MTHTESLIEKLEAEWTKENEVYKKTPSSYNEGWVDGLEAAIEIIREHTSAPDVETLARALATVENGGFYEGYENNWLRKADKIIAAMGDAYTRKDEGGADSKRVPSPTNDSIKPTCDKPDSVKQSAEQLVTKCNRLDSMGAAAPYGVLSREEDTQKTCPAPAPSEISYNDDEEDIIERCYWEFKDRSNRVGEERLSFKSKLRWFGSYIVNKHTLKPVLVSLEKCAKALHNEKRKQGLVGYTFEEVVENVGLEETQCFRQAKAVLIAAGVLYE